MALRLLSLFGIMMTFSVAGISASPCGTSGMTVVRADDGGQYVIYVFREGPDIAFQLPGKDISFPSDKSGPRIFNIEGVVFENLLVKTTDFTKPGIGRSDLELLQAHKNFEFAYFTKVQSPLTKLIEHGPRERPATGDQPPFTFYLWQMINPSEPKGASQYFLTTVSSGEVAVLSAIVPDESKVGIAMSAFQSYAGSFQHILRKQQCPEAKKK